MRGRVAEVHRIDEDDSDRAGHGRHRQHPHRAAHAHERGVGFRADPPAERRRAERRPCEHRDSEPDRKTVPPLTDQQRDRGDHERGTHISDRLRGQRNATVRSCSGLLISKDRLDLFIADQPRLAPFFECARELVAMDRT